MIKTLWIDHNFAYDGSQLRSLFAYLQFGLAGDSVLAWRGPCDVRIEHMVDGEDRGAGAEIRGGDMVHFIIEKFNCSLLAAVALQRLLTTVVQETLLEISPEPVLAQALRRSGDDLWLDQRKLSISIATVSPVSALIHFAVNAENLNTPVATLSLADLKVAPQEFGEQVLKRYSAELESVVFATQKVNWVR